MMRKNFQAILLAILALAMVACNAGRTTNADVKKAEKELYNENQSVRKENVPSMIETYCRFAEQNPNDSMAPEYLFRALEISVNFQDAEQSLKIADQLINGYPDFEKVPVALFMEATFVYDQQMGDYEKAREAFQTLIDNYPNNEFVPSAMEAIKNLGKTPEQLIREFEQMNLDSVSE